MKKAVKAAVIVLGGMWIITLFAGAIYDFLGLVWKSQENHGWKKLSGKERKAMSLGRWLELKTRAAEDVMSDVQAGWRWRRS